MNYKRFNKDVQTIVQWLLENDHDFELKKYQNEEESIDTIIFEAEFKIEGLIYVVIKDGLYDVRYSPNHWDFTFDNLETVYNCIIDSIHHIERMNNKI